MALPLCHLWGIFHLFYPVLRGDAWLGGAPSGLLGETFFLFDGEATRFWDVLVVFTGGGIRLIRAVRGTDPGPVMVWSITGPGGDADSPCPCPCAHDCACPCPWEGVWLRDAAESQTEAEEEAGLEGVRVPKGIALCSVEGIVKTLSEETVPSGGDTSVTLYGEGPSGCLRECPSTFLQTERLGVWFPVSVVGTVPTET